MQSPDFFIKTCGVFFLFIALPKTNYEIKAYIVCTKTCCLHRICMVVLYCDDGKILKFLLRKCLKIF